MNAAHVLDVASILTILRTDYGIDTDPSTGPMRVADYALIAEAINSDWSTYSTANELAQRNGWKKIKD